MVRLVHDRDAGAIHLHITVRMTNRSAITAVRSSAPSALDLLLAADGDVAPDRFRRADNRGRLAYPIARER